MKENEVLIKVEGLSKKFSKTLKSSLWYGIKDLITAIKGNDDERQLRKNEFWALQDINFEVRRGECLGLIGHNGAGKSTLLKILNGLINPDAGKVTMKGRVGALIELGAGFNPILSGRENIYNNGAVLGFSKKEIDAKVAEIIAFAELDEFIDMPVQNYSSGMRVRLGFAVAAQMEPDILLIDEVLAVGDLGFRIKCLNRIGELINECALIFVSHSMPQVSRICTKGILLERGIMKSIEEDISITVFNYYKLFEVEGERILGGENINVESVNASVNGQKIEHGAEINQGDSLKLIFDCNWNVEVSKINCKLFFINNDARIVLDIASNINNRELEVSNKNNKIEIETPPLFLNGGSYSLSLVIQNSENDERLLRYDSVFSVNVYSKYLSWTEVVAKGEWKII